MKNELCTLPENSQIEDFLRSIQPVPGAGFYKRMESAPWNKPSPKERGFVMSKKQIFHAGILTGILLLIALGFTPVGRVLAGEIIHFFNRAPADARPLPADQVMGPVPTITPAPTFAPVILPATIVVQPTIKTTKIPASDLDPNQIQNLNIMTARSLAGFTLLEPAVLPGMYRLQSIQYDPAQQAVRLKYASPQAGTNEFFSITQGKKLFPFEVGANARVKTISARGKQIEMVRGGWFSLNGTTESTWEEDAEIYTLRWEENSIAISLEFHLNEPASPVYLHQEEMVEIVKGLTDCQPSGSADKFTCEINRAAKAAGFNPWLFPQTSDGFSFKSVDYQPGATAIRYIYGSGEIEILQSRENITTRETKEWSAIPDEAIHMITVSGQAAEYAIGSPISSAGEDHATWNANADQIRLRWRNYNWWFQIIKSGELKLQPQKLADIASLLADVADGMNKNEPDQIESNRVGDAYLKLEDAAKAYGRKLFVPALLPEVSPFSHARITENGGIMLFYGNFAADKIRSTGATIFISQGKKLESVAGSYADYPPEAIESVKINGQPATLIAGIIELGFDKSGQPIGKPVWRNVPPTLSIHWETADQYYMLQFHSGYGSGAIISKTDLITVAESLEEYQAVP